LLYLDACVFLLSFRELSREFADNVESFRDNESACCTPERTADSCFSATLLHNIKQKKMEREKIVK